jgi:predicted ArsR family transcriptional regulator
MNQQRKLVGLLEMFTRNENRMMNAGQIARTLKLDPRTTRALLRTAETDRFLDHETKREHQRGRNAKRFGVKYFHATPLGQTSFELYLLTGRLVVPLQLRSAKPPGALTEEQMKERDRNLAAAVRDVMHKLKEEFAKYPVKV